MTISVDEVIDGKTTRTEPFSDEYCRQEIEFYGTKPYKNRADTLRVVITQPRGSLNEYFNKQYMLGQLNVPTLITRGPGIAKPEAAGTSLRRADSGPWHLWMSLTPMEVQSSYLAIHRAEGLVGTAGLGLGYYALRAAAKESVEEVIVFEENKDTIKYFKYRFKDRPYFKKVKIVEGDARQTCKGYSFDFFFADIYKTLLPDQCLEDIKLFCDQNDMYCYQFWGEERILFHMLIEKVLPDGWLRWDEKILFQRFISDQERLQLYDPVGIAHNEEFVKRYMELAEQYTDR